MLPEKFKEKYFHQKILNIQICRLHRFLFRLLRLVVTIMISSR